jgi:hypothetical protein
MQLIFNQQYFNATMSSLNYDANKLPLGKLSKATILRGFQALKDLSALIDDNSLAVDYGMAYGAAVEQLSNTFYSLIPHAFGRNRPPVINDQQMLKREIELLESLSDMKDAALIMKTEKAAADDIHPLDKQFQGLKMQEMTPLDHTGTEFTQLHNYLQESRGSTHGHQYTVESIFRIERQGEYDRFDNSDFGKMSQNRRLLWHGSRCTNFGGILSVRHVSHVTCHMHGLPPPPPPHPPPLPKHHHHPPNNILHVTDAAETEWLKNRARRGPSVGLHVWQRNLFGGHGVEIGELLLLLSLRRHGAPFAVRGGAWRPYAGAY